MYYILLVSCIKIVRVLLLAAYLNIVLYWIFKKKKTIFFFTMWYTYIPVSCLGSSDDQSEASTALVVVGSLFLVLGIICLGLAVFLYYNLSEYCIYWINFYWHFNIFCMFCNASITNCRITLVTYLSRMRKLRQTTDERHCC